MAEFIRQSRVKIRKPHHCWGCQRKYDIGTAMEVNVSVDAGQIFSTYFCTECVEVLDNMDDTDDLGYGDLLNDEEYYERIKAAQLVPSS